MASKVVWHGLAEFQYVLRNLPDALATEARRIGEANARAAAFDIRSEYSLHRRTGGLADSVLLEEHNVAFGFRYLVRIKPKKKAHARWIEYGTAVRHYVTAAGVKHLTGAARAFHIFEPRIDRHQRRMYDQLKALLERNGLLVTGHAD